MGEPYRTLLGHFRHEIGHFYWDELVLRDSDQLARFRELFGDERADYGDALKQHYANGASEGWEETFISAYATSHPWEDFAETWAHYLHMVDAVETGLAFNVGAKNDDPGGITSVDAEFDPYRAEDINAVIDNWIPLSILMNDLNRAIGQSDAYAFVITPVVQEKLGFIHSLVHDKKISATR